jgi:hypothetical protein
MVHDGWLTRGATGPSSREIVAVVADVDLDSTQSSRFVTELLAAVC